MNLRYVALCGLLCAAGLVSGCDEGRKAPGKATVQVANVAPGFETLTFRREQNVARDEELLFKGAGAHVYDADTYDFKVEELKLTLTRPKVPTPLVYGKIGD